MQYSSDRASGSAASPGNSNAQPPADRGREQRHSSSRTIHLPGCSIEPVRVGSDRIGSDRIGSDRIGWYSMGMVLNGTKRTGLIRSSLVYAYYEYCAYCTTTMLLAARAARPRGALAASTGRAPHRAGLPHRQAGVNANGGGGTCIKYVRLNPAQKKSEP